jgi:transcriptional regulator with XRE-family HTH domain
MSFLVHAQDSLEGLSKVLIQARIAAGLTQEDLAARLDVKPQQIQCYEASDYQTASFARLREIARLLGLRIRESCSRVAGPYNPVSIKYVRSRADRNASFLI